MPPREKEKRKELPFHADENPEGYELRTKAVVGSVTLGSYCSNTAT